MTQPNSHPDIIHWKDRVLDWYPDLYKRTLFLPPVYMRRTQHESKRLSSGDVVRVSVPPTKRPGQTGILPEKDVHEDDAHQTVLCCLQQLADTEVMFVISQLLFGDYLNEVAYAAAASLLPRATDPVLKSQKKDEGDFDVLIVSRHYGILAGEIKSAGKNMHEYSATEQEQDNIIEKKVVQAIDQMHKSKDVLAHLVSDLKTHPRITASLMLPNVPRVQLSRVLAANEQLREKLCESLDVDVNTDPVPLCLTTDDVIDPRQWWQQRMTGSSPDPAMKDPDVYLELVSRLCGPATTVTVYCPSVPRLSRDHSSDVRTPGEGVEETACRFAPADIVLHPKQVAILNQQKPRVFLSGPPGSGKSLVLFLKAKLWLSRGKPVHVVSTYEGSVAVSHMIFSQLRHTKPDFVGNLLKCVHHFNFFKLDEEVDRAVTTLASLQQDGELYLICDEVFNTSTEQPFTTFCEKLRKCVWKLSIWAASPFLDLRPEMLIDVSLTEPLRTPPAVTREVEKCSDLDAGGRVHAYSSAPSPLPCDGPAVLNIVHTGQDKHNADSIKHCWQCGREIAKVLKDLHVGNTTRRSHYSPRPIRYRDTFILTYWDNLHDIEIDTSGRTIRPASGLLQGLRQAGIPVTVLKKGDTDGVKQVAIMAGPDNVIAAHSHDVHGLERKIIVFVHGASTDDDDSVRLHALSRCTSQLVWVRNQARHPTRKPLKPISLLTRDHPRTDGSNC